MVISLVCDLSYKIPPTHMNKPEETNPCAIPKIIPPSIPCIVLLNTANKYTAACETELYAINSFISIVLRVLMLAYIIVITPITNTIYVKLIDAFGIMGNINLNTPYRLNLRTIPANNILPPNGDSTCAFNNQVFKNITGVFTANAINIP